MKKIIISITLVFLLLNTAFLALAIVNNPQPNPPTKPDGPNSGLKINTQYDYSVDGQGGTENDIKVWFDFGDGDENEYYYAGEGHPRGHYTLGHVWEEKGSYTIRAYAEDTVTGEISDWSESLTISIKKSCFIAGSRVTMADDSYRIIEDIRVGDLVKAYDINAEEFLDAEVITIYHHEPEEMDDHYLIINGRLGVTPNHLIYVNDELLPAGELKEGDFLTSDIAPDVEITSLNQVFNQVPTYHFEITPLGENYGITVGYCYIVENIIVYSSKWGLSEGQQQQQLT